MDLCKIAFISHPYHRGGVTQWMANAFNNFLDRRQKVFFVTVKPGHSSVLKANRPLILDLLNNKANSVFFTSAGITFELGTIQYRANVYKQIIEANVPRGTFLIPSDDEACWMAACALSDTYRVIGTLHADEEIYYSMAKIYGAYTFSFICVAERIRQKLVELLPSVAQVTETIHCGIPLQVYQAYKKVNQIAWVGRLSIYQKRAQDIPKIWNKIRIVDDSAKLIVAGHGDFSEELDDYIKSLPNPRSVEATGWLPNAHVLSVLSRSKVFLQTSDFEGMSVAVMEALASGCCIVSSRVSGIEDIAKMDKYNEVVKLFEPGDVDRAAELVLEAINNYNEELQQNAIKLSREMFDISVTNKRLVSFISSLRPATNKSFKLSGPGIILSPVIAYLRWLKWRIFS